MTRREERHFLYWLRGNVEPTVILELREGLYEEEAERLESRVAKLPKDSVALIDVAQHVEWKHVVRAIDVFVCAELFDILLAAPSGEGVPEPGVRLIEDPAGHPALERIIRAKRD
jgi:hypothetical protein